MWGLRPPFAYQLFKEYIMILLSKAYKGYLAATIVQLATQEEAALIAQGLATTSAGPVTAGAVTTSATSGRVGIAAAGSSVVVTNAAFTTESKFVASLSNAAADATATSITRITPAAGSVTFTLNAASTGIVAIDWTLLLVSGELPPN
jgi:subtilisin family serine protease